MNQRDQLIDFIATYIDEAHECPHSVNVSHALKSKIISYSGYQVFDEMSSPMNATVIATMNHDNNPIPVLVQSPSVVSEPESNPALLDRASTVELENFVPTMNRTESPHRSSVVRPTDSPVVKSINGLMRDSGTTNGGNNNNNNNNNNNSPYHGATYSMVSSPSAAATASSRAIRSGMHRNSLGLSIDASGDRMQSLIQIDGAVGSGSSEKSKTGDGSRGDEHGSTLRRVLNASVTVSPSQVRELGDALQTLNSEIIVLMSQSLYPRFLTNPLYKIYKYK